MAITLPTESASFIIASLRRYAAENLDIELDVLPANMLLDFILKEIAPSVYNQAIADSQAYFIARVTDMEGICFEEEFTYWNDTPRGNIRRKHGD